MESKFSIGWPVRGSRMSSGRIPSMSTTIVILSRLLRSGTGGKAFPASRGKGGGSAWRCRCWSWVRPKQNRLYVRLWSQRVWAGVGIGGEVPVYGVAPSGWGGYQWCWSRWWCRGASQHHGKPKQMRIRTNLRFDHGCANCKIIGEKNSLVRNPTCRNKTSREKANAKIRKNRCLMQTQTCGLKEV